MVKFSQILFFAFILSYGYSNADGCPNVPSTEEIESEIELIDKEIKEVTGIAQKYSGGLLAVLTNARLETLQSTKAMLEQKKTGVKNDISVSYLVDGVKYSPPKNKKELLQELKQDLEKLENDLARAEKESSKYSGGLLGGLSLTQGVIVKTSIAFLEQKRLLLKHDIPYYSILPTASKSNEPSFKPTPGNDIDKF